MSIRLSPQRPLADAELDHRVAYADAHDAYEAALARAAADLLSAVSRADRLLAIAQAQHRTDDLEWSKLSAYYADRATGLLTQDLGRFRYMVSPEYGVHRDRSLEPLARSHIRLISAELSRRGVDVS